jgi:hypothetical protein
MLRIPVTFSSVLVKMLSTLTTTPSPESLILNLIGVMIPSILDEAIISIGRVTVFILATLRPVTCNALCTSTDMYELILADWAFIMVNQPLGTGFLAVFFLVAV